MSSHTVSRLGATILANEVSRSAESIGLQAAHFKVISVHRPCRQKPAPKQVASLRALERL